MYKVGDKVVYPHHGAGTVVKKETREILGEKREYLTIKILHNDMTVNVPSENADKVGLRRVIGEKEVAVVLKEGVDGITRVSMRSLGAVDVCRVASAEGGGGHRFAAGFTSDDPAEVVVQRLLDAL